MAADGSESRNASWLKEWEGGSWNYIYTQPGQMLEKHFERLTDGRKGLKILVPLTATTYDLIWLCEQGHTVVGADLAESAAQRLFKQYKQTPIVEDVPSINGKLYKNSSGTFKYYVGDFLKFSEQLEGRFDFIWDAAALCALDVRDREKYLTVIKKIIGSKCTMMLECPKETFEEGKAPYHFTQSELEGFYGDKCDVQLLGEGEFDFSKVLHGDLDDQGNPVCQPGKKDEEEEGMIFTQTCYCLKKRD